ncbi:hypothetical protein R1sor_026086 [Riccia sorocarpa]|uniref:RWD domain-containing protein n=1 Tax=Riccia sorocarpa TaxID=122646 RepID=A0ABD3GAE1_9MARC
MAAELFPGIFPGLLLDTVDDEWAQDKLPNDDIPFPPDFTPVAEEIDEANQDQLANQDKWNELGLHTLQQAQNEEKLALTSIYTDDFLKETSSGRDDISYLVKLAIEPQEEDIPHTRVILNIHLPPTYPQSDPPVYELKEAYGEPPWLKNEHHAVIRAELLSMFKATATGSTGQHDVVLFEWIEWLKTWLENSWLEFLVENPEIVSRFRSKALKEEFEMLARVPDSTDSEEGLKITETSSPSVAVNVPPVHHSKEPLVDRKSVFIAHVARVTSVQEVEQVKQYLLSNPKIAKATHNILAYRIVQPRSGKGKHAVEGETVISDCDDDGENAAGGRLLHLLEMCKCKNVVVVVSRWYGGTLLGPDRFKHINNVARELLDAHGFIAK